MKQDVTRDRCRELEKQVAEAYRAYERATIRLSNLQRLCKHPEPSGMLCKNCGLRFDHDTGEALYPDFAYQYRMAIKKADKQFTDWLRESKRKRSAEHKQNKKISAK